MERGAYQVNPAVTATFNQPTFPRTVPPQLAQTHPRATPSNSTNTLQSHAAPSDRDVIQPVDANLVLTQPHGSLFDRCV